MSSLYLDHFGLNLPPFSITPDPNFFFEGKDRGVFISGLLHASLQAEGIVVVIGEVGSGKTLMSRILLKRLSSQVDTVYLPNPAFSRHEIIDVIARDLGIDGVVLQQGVRLEVLQQELIKRHEQGRQVVVLIDEAHAMPLDSIEEIRRLSNLETDNRKLVQVVLCGQPELDTLLEAPHLRQVRDRVVYRLTLHNLSKEDAKAYLEHRLRIAGWRGGRMFSWYAERLLLHDAKGRARRLNLLADKALLAAYADNNKQVRAKHVRLAIRDIGANFATPQAHPRRQWGLTAAWLTSIALTAIGSMYFTSSLAHQSMSARPTASPIVASPAHTPPPAAPSPSIPVGTKAPPSPPLTAQAKEGSAPASAQGMTATATSTPEPAHNAGQDEAPQRLDATPAATPEPSKHSGTTHKPAGETAAATLPAASQTLAAPEPLPAAGQETKEAAAPIVAAEQEQTIATTAPAQHTSRPATAARPGGIAGQGVRPEELARRVTQSYAHARRQSALGSYSIQLASLSLFDNAGLFLARAEQELPAQHIYIRRSLAAQPADPQQKGGYVFFFGNFPTHDAAKLAMAELPERLLRGKPLIRNWKNIYDAPWSL